MPNQSYCGPSEEIAMADCNLSLPFPAVKNEERLCKYSYASWCPTCDKDSPRRRTRSETNETCRRKGREMKTFTPKKYIRCQEYENMELEYEPKDLRYDCCRIRSNLCELPTTYISNNCQLFSNMSNLTKVSTGHSDYFEKPPKAFENSYQLIDFSNSSQNFISMTDKHSKLVVKTEDYFRNSFENQKSNSNKLDIFNKNYNLNGIKSSQCVETRKTKHLCEASKQEYNTVFPKKHFKSGSLVLFNSNGDNTLKVEKCNFRPKQQSQVDLPHREEKPTDVKTLKLKSNSPKSVLTKSNLNCNVYDLKFREVLDASKLSYDTCTFFNKRDIDTSNLNERYCQEVELLRGRLKEIKKNQNQELLKKIPDSNKEIIQINSSSECGTVKIINNVIKFKKSTTLRGNSNSQSNNDDKKVENVIKETDQKNKTYQKERLEKFKSEKSQRTTVKTKSKLGAIKSKQIRNKVANSVTGKEVFESDISDGEEEAINIEESEESVKNSITSAKEKVRDKEQPSQIGAGDGSSWPLRESLFPNIPPYISFNAHDAEIPFNVPNRKYLKWKLSTITPIVVRKTLTNTGFRLVRKSNEWLGTWGKHMKSPMFKTLKEVQKLNHFPGTFQIGRKDKLWRNLQRLMCRFGMKEFGFIPQTYVLPQDFKLLKQNWEFKNGSGSEVFIIKPPASARGVGIKVINKWSQLPKKTSLVVQQYISNPYLINGSKFDLRLYVLVTSFNPMRIYLYPDGLARFASAKYSDDVKDLKDRYMHLTNYSINKLSSQYTANEDANACQGHKWTLSKLWEYMEKEGVDTKALWKSLENLVIKTIISGESPITQLSKESLNSRYNCYELFGVDVLLDERLKPWLLEVNISPSLHSASPLDAYVKGPLVKALFDMAQFHLPPKLRKTQNMPSCFDPKLYTTALLKKERNKHNYFSQVETREEYLDEVLEVLTGDDVRHLTQAEDELTVTGPFERIFPTSQSYKYLQFMEVRYYNRLFDAWEHKYERNRQPGIRILQSLCNQKLHLKVASQTAINKNLESMILAEVNLPPLTGVTTQSNNMDNLRLPTSSVNP